MPDLDVAQVEGLTHMRTIRFGVATATLAAAACLSAPASAGDYGRSVKDAPVMMSAAGPCYFRGDLGYSWSSDPSATFAQAPGPTFLFVTEAANATMDNTWLIGAGLGCGSGSRGIRGEVMYDYRGDRDITGTLAAPLGGTVNTSVKTQTLMFNGYYDLGKWDRVVPYVGVGVGLAHNSIDAVTFSALPNQLLSEDRWSMAWSLMAGLGWQLSERAILDVGYRYIDMGKVESSRIDTSGFTNNPPFRLDDLTAHEFKIGLRYHFGGGEPASFK
jgi:opacity protein-like surface antigen